MKKYYDLSVIVLAIISVVLVAQDIAGNISLSSEPYKSIDFAILIFFWIDYLIRMYAAQNKKHFIKNNIADLIAILPFNALFSAFRVFRVMRIIRITKFARLVRALGFAGKLNAKLKVFLNTNNFIYVLYASFVLIFASSVLMTYVEGQSFGDALWWSIVTCTTVGYGDISPSTVSGRIIAVVLMVFGIGLLGMLTGTITTYFTVQKKEATTHAENIFEDLSEEQMQKVVEYAAFLKSRQ